MQGERHFAEDYFTDETTVTLELELGEARALAMIAASRPPCAGRCGREECEVMGFRSCVAQKKLCDVLLEAGDAVVSNLDARAGAIARLDQWESELKERGLL